MFWEAKYCPDAIEDMFREKHPGIVVEESDDGIDPLEVIALGLPVVYANGERAVPPGMGYCGAHKSYFKNRCLACQLGIPKG